MRGLKPLSNIDNAHGYRSHLLQMRGLKHKWSNRQEEQHVASFTDAWIETIVNVEPVRSIESHLLQMRGLKHFLNNAPNSYTGRIFYRCVD